jgi:hypothetical protein
MAGVSLGSAEFSFLVDNRDAIVKGAQAEAALKKNYEAIAKSAGVSAAEVERSAKRMAEAQSKAAQSFKLSGAEIIKGTAAFAGLHTAAESLRKVVDSVAESTKNATQAQFALSKTYGQGAAEMTAFSKSFGDEIGKSNIAVQQAAVTMGVLTKSYGLSESQARNLVRITADLAAVHGEDLKQAAKDVQAAIRGEAEAAEKLGVALGDTRVRTSQLGQDSEKLWNTLTEEEKATLRLFELQKQLAGAHDAAAERAKGPLGAFDRLTKVSDELGAELGTRLMPAVAAVADVLATMGTGALEALDALNDLSNFDTDRLLEIASLLFNPAGVVAAKWTGAQMPWQREGSAGAARDAARKAKEDQERITAQEETARRVAQIKRNAEERAALEQREKDAKKQVEINQDRIDREQEANTKAYEARRTQLEAERETKLRTVEAQKDAALAAIETEARAAKEASDSEIRDLQVAKQEEERIAADAHEAELARIDVEQRAVDAATEEQIRQAEIARDAAKQAAEDRRDAVVKAIEEETEAIKAQRTEEDRIIADGRAAEDRDLQDSREAEERKYDDRKARLERALDEEHQARGRFFESEQQRIEDEKEARLRALDDEVDAVRGAAEQAARIRDAAHEQNVRRFEQEADAVRGAAEQAARERADLFEQESRARDAAHEQATRQAEAEHQQRVRGFEAEADAARDAAEQADRARDAAHQATLRRLDDEADAARDAHDETIRGLEERARAEDDRHRDALAAIDEESRQRLAAIDAELGILDAADKAEEQEARRRGLLDAVTNAEFGVKRAISTGNQSEIVKAQQELAQARAAITRDEVKNQRDAARDVLRARAEAIKEQARLAKEAENEENRRREREIADERRTAGDVLKAILDRLAGEKQAAQDAHRDADQASKDALAAALDDIAARKQAEADAYAAAKTAAQDAYETARTQARDAYDTATRAAKDALDRQLADIAARKLAEQQAYEAQKQAARDATDRAVELLGRQKDAVTDATNHALRKLGEKQTAEQDDYDKAKIRLGDLLQKEKDRLTDRRLAEDRALKDGRTAEDRALADSRIAQDLALKHRKDAAQDEYENTQRLLRATYDDEATGQIPALRRAMEAARENFRLRKIDADNAYQDEQRRIRDTYEHEQTGLIPMARRAQAAVQQSFRDQATEVTASAQAQAAAIRDEYSNADKTGLLDLLKRAHDETKENLEKQGKYWESYAKKIKEEVEKALKDLEALAKAQQQVPGGIGPPLPPLQGGGGSGGGSNPYGNDPTGQFFTIPGTQTKVELGSIPYSVAPNATIPNPDPSKVEAFIRQVAPQYGIPAEDAIRVWSGEGRSAYVGDHGTSFGPYQLHIGGGLGNDFIQTYKADLRDPNTWQQQVLYTMAYVQRHGWNGQWHGAPSDLKYKRYADGGWIDRASWLVDQKTGERWGSIAENDRRELVVPEHRAPSLNVGSAYGQPYQFAASAMATPAAAAMMGRRDRIDVDITFDNQTKERLVFEGIGLLVRRGDLVEVRR